jgi:hypothetical protein
MHGPCYFAPNSLAFSNIHRLMDAKRWPAERDIAAGVAAFLITLTQRFLWASCAVG